MKLSDVFDARAIALNHTENASNRVPYLGLGLFPAKKKMGLDLKWIKTHKGLPVSLAPSNFDAKSTIRTREGFKLEKTQMAFFRESMLVKEEDEQEILRAQESNDPYALAVLESIYDDTRTLIDAADVVPERMRMQILAPDDGSPKIHIEANGVTYAYNYDPDGSYAASNFTELSTSTTIWTDFTNSDPLADIAAGQDAVESATGSRPAIALMSKKTMGYLKKNKKIQSAILAQNMSANIFMTDARVKELFSQELGITIVVYNKMYKDEAGNVNSFYPDDMVTLLPAGALGNTWYGTTPEERTLMGNAEANVSIVNTGVAIAVTTTSDPVNTKTTASEIVLPSYERMDETYVIKVVGDSVIDTVTIDGTPKKDEATAVTIAYNIDPDTAPTLAYKWKIGDTAAGTFTDIAGATSATYTPVTADVDKYIKVEVTASGSATGTKLSAAKKVVSGE